MTFQIPETVICSIEVRNQRGELTDPDLVVISILGNGILHIDNEEMTRQSIGKYYYDFQTEQMQPGKYTAIYTITDGQRVTIHRDIFALER